MRGSAPILLPFLEVESSQCMCAVRRLRGVSRQLIRIKTCSQIMLPGSIFATEGARAIGDAGRMPHGHKEVAGLQIAYVARDALTAHLRCPVFGRVTTLNRKKGGGKANMGGSTCGRGASGAYLE